jgi:IclR family acetate operon transcriptional repressor
MQEGKIIQSVAKAMRLLDIIAASAEPMSLSEIHEVTRWPKSTIHGLLSTMRETSVVAQDSEGRYMLGIRLFEYGCTLSSSWTIIEKAKPFIQHISYQTGETVFLSILDCGEVITLDRADNRTGLQATAEMGCRLPIHCTSQGKLFLAHMKEEERNEILSRQELTAYTSRTITEESRLLRELELIRERGYSVESGEYKSGLRSVAAPIRDEHGNVRYAIGIIGMYRQLETDNFDRAIGVVCDTAERISRSYL